MPGSLRRVHEADVHLLSDSRSEFVVPDVITPAACTHPVFLILNWPINSLQQLQEKHTIEV